MIWLAIITVAYGATIALFWPLMRDNAGLIDDYMKLFPEGFMAAFGMAGSLADPGVFFNTYMGSWLWPILAAVAAIMLATRPVAADLERGFIELPLSTALSRGALPRRVDRGPGGGADPPLVRGRARLLVRRHGRRRAVRSGPDAGRGRARLGLRLCRRRRELDPRGRHAQPLRRPGIVIALLLAMYLLFVVAKMQPDLDGLAHLSAMYYFQPTPIIERARCPSARSALRPRGSGRLDRQPARLPPSRPGRLRSPGAGDGDQRVAAVVPA